MARSGGAAQKPMTMKSHLLELRNRFFLVVGVLIVAASVAYPFREPLIAGLMAPLDGRQLQYLTPGGGFKFIFSIVFFAGLAVSIPLLLQQTYAFLSPVLSDRVRKRGGWLLLWSTVLLAIGVTFGYIYAVPGALNFLYGFADQFVVSALTADAYLDFIIKYTLGLGLMFQIPLVMMITHWIKPQKPLKLLKFERWVILLAFILAAIITPTPDPVNQTIIAVPIIAIYQFGLIAICLNIWRGNREVRQEKRANRKAAKAMAKQTRKKAAAAKPATVTAVKPAIAPQSTVATPVVSITPEKQSVPTAAPMQPQRPKRSIDGIVITAPRVDRHHIQVPTAAKPTVTVPQRAVQAAPRTPQNGARRPLSIDGMTRMVSA